MESVSSDQPTTVPEVISRLNEIQEAAVGYDERGVRDGLACFNYLYSHITEHVLENLDKPDGFTDREFIATLDVEFAKRYLLALERYAADPSSAPRSWRVLLDRRADRHIAPLQFALAGVNAHVNYDLAFALVTTCEAMGSTLGADTQRRDYQLINGIFAEQMSGLRHHFEDLVERELDESAMNSLNDHVDDIVVVLTRDAAWHRGRHLWTLRKRAAVMLEQAESTDLLVSLANRGILAHL
jgi:hypothetical protein